MNKSLEALLKKNPRVFRIANEPVFDTASGLATGYAELDQRLPWGGWPAAALTEILIARDGGGELELLMPALATISHEDDPHWIVWITPPYLPYPPALAHSGVALSRVLLVRTRRQADALWAAEQALRSDGTGAVLLWSNQISPQRIRRLQLAAKEGDTFGVLVRPLNTRNTSSPAALRIAVEPVRAGFDVQIFKARGGRPGQVRLKRG